MADDVCPDCGMPWGRHSRDILDPVDYACPDTTEHVGRWTGAWPE